MTRAVWKIVFSAAMVALWGATAHAQSPLDAIAAIDMEEIERLADLAQAGTDRRVTATMREQYAESGPNFRTLPAILVSIEGEPAFVYVKERLNSEIITFVMRCRGSGIVDLSYDVFASRPLYNSDEQVEFDEVAGQIMEFGRNVRAVMRLTPYNINASYDMPVAAAYTHENHGQTDPDGNIRTIHVQLVGAANSSDQFFRNLRGTSNLSGSISVNGKWQPLRTGVGLDNFRETAGPLLEHCQAGNNNPMDRDLVPMSEPPLAEAIVAPPVNLDLSFLDAPRSQFIQRIYQGHPAAVDAPLHLRLTIPIAYHAAYSHVCAAQSDAPHDFVYTDIFGQSLVIAVPPDDFASLFQATLIYEPVIRKLYDERVNNDFSFQQVLDIYRRDIVAWNADWQAVLGRHGCTGEVIDKFRHNMKSELPFVEYGRGSRNVLVDFGGRQYEISLSSPIDVETARQVGMAEAESGNDAVFGNSYPGKILRAIAVGNFAQVETINGQLRELVSNPFGGDPDNPISTIFRLAMEFDSAINRDSGVLTAYAIGRTYHLGACGDAMTTYSQDTAYWTEYVNGFGQHVSSSSPETRTSVAEIPSKFDAIVRANNSIDTSWYLDLEMARIVSRMSCESPARQQLEDNMIAYFNRRPPVHIGPVPAN